MFSKKSLHVTLAFVLLIGLAAMGLAYGAWADELKVNGTVTTGTVDVDFWQVSTIDSDGDAFGATCTVVESTEDQLTFELANAYPGFSCKIVGNMKNTGTVPVVIDEIIPSGSISGFQVTPYAAGDLSLVPGEEVYGDILFLTLTTAEEGQTYTGEVTFTFKVQPQS